MKDAFEDEQQAGPKGLSEKLLVWFFAAVKMKIILEIFPTILGVKIAKFYTFY